MGWWRVVGSGVQSRSELRSETGGVVDGFLRSRGLVRSLPFFFKMHPEPLRGSSRHYRAPTFHRVRALCRPRFRTTTLSHMSDVSDPPTVLVPLDCLHGAGSFTDPHQVLSSLLSRPGP